MEKRDIYEPICSQHFETIILSLSGKDIRFKIDCIVPSLVAGVPPLAVKLDILAEDEKHDLAAKLMEVLVSYVAKLSDLN